MPNYKFTFPAAATGLPVTVTDPEGTAIATNTLGEPSEVQGGIVYSVGLTAGDYTARAVDAAIFADFRAPGILDITNSTVTLGAEPYYFQNTSGGTMSPGGGQNLTFDEALDGQIDIPNGLYLVDIGIDFSEADELRYATVNVSMGSNTKSMGPFAIVSNSTYPSYSRSVMFTIPAVYSDEANVVINVMTFMDADVVEPAAIGFSYAWAQFTKIA